jgi:hypothetical protein
MQSLRRVAARPDPRPDQTRGPDLGRQRRRDDPTVAWIAILPGSILGDHKWSLDQFYLLDHMPTLQRSQSPRLLGRQLTFDNLVHFVRPERFPLMLGMPRLSADRPLAPSLGRFGLRRFDNVAGGRFGAISGVLLPSRQFGLQFGDPRLQRRNGFGNQLANFVFRKSSGHAPFITKIRRSRNTN